MAKRTKLQQYLESKDFVTKSECVISMMNTKLKIINAELSMRNGRQVMHSSSSRIKSYDSLHGKLQRKKLPEDICTVKEKINDLVGIRAVCSYTDDLYQMAEMLCRQKDIHVIKTKDYIRNPKATGYRSLHLILELDMHFQDGNQKIKVEVQLRTAAMDYWAGLDYQLQYKKENKCVESIRQEMKDYATAIEEIDRRVLELRKRIEAI